MQARLRIMIVTSTDAWETAVTIWNLRRLQNALRQERLIHFYHGTNPWTI